MNIDIIRYKIRKKKNKFADKLLSKYNLSYIFKSLNTDILILDDFYPCPLSNFRFIEFNEYLKHYKTLVFTTGKSLPFVNVYDSVNKYIRQHPERNKIKVFQRDRKVNAKLAVLVFQHNAEIFLDYLEKNKIPFIFTLYPGGNFKLNEKRGDEGLKRIFNSSYFRKVIVTQRITHQYLIDKKLCKPDDIELIYGCPIDIKQDEDCNKNLKNEFVNLCFVAAKYHPTGMDKGYDIFIEVAKLLCKSSKKYRFHVVGGFNKDDINISEIQDCIRYYGYLDLVNLKRLYENMDFIISPNRSNILSSGAFDGFPTAAVVEAGLKGVIMVLTDDLNQNIYLKNYIDCIFTDHSPENILEKLIEVSDNLKLKQSISNNGQQILFDLFSKEKQLNRRIEIINSLINIQ